MINRKNDVYKMRLLTQKHYNNNYKQQKVLQIRTPNYKYKVSKTKFTVGWGHKWVAAPEDTSRK